MPQVSVIIPVYNGEKYIQKTLRSVLNQTFQDFEIIIIDDGSTDNSANLIKKVKDKRIRYFRQKNSGCPAISRNVGLKKAQGKFIAFIDQDDLWLPHKLEKQVRILQKYPKVGAVFSNCWIFDDLKKKKVGKVWLNIQNNYPNSAQVKKKLLEGNFILTASCAIIRTALLNQIGGFDESMKLADDYDLWFRLSLKTNFIFLKPALAIWRMRPSSLSKDNKKLLKDLIYFYSKILNYYYSNLKSNEKKIIFKNLADYQLRFFNYLLKKENKLPSQAKLHRIKPITLKQIIIFWMLSHWPLLFKYFLRVKDLVFSEPFTITPLEVNFDGKKQS